MVQNRVPRRCVRPAVDGTGDARTRSGNRRYAISPAIKVKAFSHPLGETTVTVFGTAKLAAPRRKNFPQSLDAAPFLYLPTGKTLRRTLDHWFDQQGIRPRIVASGRQRAVDDVWSGRRGLFVAPTVIEKEVMRQYGVVPVGRLDAVRERYFAISIERRLKHPAVVAISEAANEMLAGERSRSGALDWTNDASSFVPTPGPGRGGPGRGRVPLQSAPVPRCRHSRRP